MYMISAAVARIEYFFSGFVFSFLKDFITFADVFRIKGKTSAEVAQLVEHQLPKLRVAGSSPVFRSTKPESRQGKPPCVSIVHKGVFLHLRIHPPTQAPARLSRAPASIQSGNGVCMSFERGGAIREFNPILRNFDRLSDQKQVKGNSRPKRNSVRDG